MLANHVGLLYLCYVAWRFIGNISSMYHRHIIRQHLFDIKLSLQNFIVSMTRTGQQTILTLQ